MRFASFPKCNANDLTRVASILLLTTVSLHAQQQQSSGEVARRLGVVVDYLAAEAVEATEIANSLPQLSLEEIKQFTDRDSAGGANLARKVVQDLREAVGPGTGLQNPKELAAFKSDAANQIIDAAGRASEYAYKLSIIQPTLANLSNADAIGRLQSISVPAEAEALLTPRDEIATSEVTSAKPIAPFVVGVGGGHTIDFPAVAAVLNLDQDNHLRAGCTGTLIAPDIVITAAHCTVQLKRLKGVYFAHAGIFYLAQPPIIHPAFKADLKELPNADLALLVLAQPVSGIAPVKMNVTKRVAIGTEARVVGFGASKFYDVVAGTNTIVPLSDVDPFTGLKIRGSVRTSPCNHIFGDRSICWLYEQNGPDFGTTCKGDSGGPLFVGFRNDTVLSGITSGGDPAKPCAEGSQAYDVEIAYYAHWIRDKVETHSKVVNWRRDALDPISANQRYLLSAKREKFLGQGRQWQREIVVPSDLESVRISANSSPQGTDLTIKLETVSTPQPEMICDAESQGSVASCRVDDPPPGKWLVSISSDVERDFQAVITSFAKSN